MTSCTGVNLRNLLFSFSLTLFSVVATSQTGSAPVKPPAAPSPQSAPSLTIKAYAEEVVVDVVVTDKSGKPVQNLSGEHFKVLDDGRPQQVKSFQEFGNARATQAAATPLPANVYTNVVTPGQQIAPVILLLDGLNTELKDQQYMRVQILQYLKRIPAGTPVAVFSMAPGLHLVAGLTTDMSVIKTAVANTSFIAQSPLLDSSLSIEEQERTENGGQPADLMVGADDPISDQLVQFTEALRSERRMDHRVEFTLASFEVLARYLGRYPGRKSLMWFSGSFPLYLTPDLSPSTFGSESAASSSGPAASSDASAASASDPTFQLMVNDDYSFEVRHATDMLMASHVAVYPIDVRGVVVTSVNDVEHRGLPINAPGNPNFQQGSTMKGYLDFAGTQAALRNSMTQIANATGGHAFYGSNDLAGLLGKAVRDAATYYELSYTPDLQKLDEKYHKIKVVVNQPGVRAACREGYYADDPSKHPALLSSRANLLKLELEHGTTPADQIQFYASPLPLAKQPDLDDPAKRIGDFGPRIKGPVVRYGIDWLVHLPDIRATLLPNGNRTGKLTFAAVAYDSEGIVRNSHVTTTEFNLSPQRYEQIITGKGMPCFQELDLPKGSVALRLALIDDSSGRTGSIEIPLDVK
jgi:VWFA-related protein